ncbi:MAG TPA: S41 family peptidase [Candidatus Rubrimentiphilum sp.]|nr:S41 family peptidase [Candidatus Rubrimentiphilum sp.]
MNRYIALICAAAFLTGAAPQQISPLDASEIQFSYDKLRSDFYRKTDAQSIVDGARTGLARQLCFVNANLKTDPRTIAAAVQRCTPNTIKKLPPVFAAATSSARTAQAVDHEVDLAARLSRGKLSSHLASYAAIAGMLDSVHDRYTTFLSPKEYAELNQGLDGGSFAGTGIVIEQDDKTQYIDVSNVVPDGPADKAGVMEGDEITAIDGLSTKGMKLQTASSHLRGKAGTPVQLTIERAGKQLTAPITIVRAQIRELSVYEKMLPGKIGYVELTVFGRDTGAELQQALDRLQQEGARALVLDLRDNGGGYLESAIDVSSKFIASGPIVSVESRASNVTTYEAEDTAIAPLPLAVLVNDHTASASEITTAAIQDSGVGTVIGTKTFGKGVVQEILPLPDGAAIKITDARYLTPRNRDINQIGITPDIAVTENTGASFRFGDPVRDAQLARAVQFLDQRIAQTSGAS